VAIVNADGTIRRGPAPRGIAGADGRATPRGAGVPARRHTPRGLSSEKCEVEEVRADSLPRLEVGVEAPPPAPAPPRAHTGRRLGPVPGATASPPRIGPGLERLEPVRRTRGRPRLAAGERARREREGAAIRELLALHRWTIAAAAEAIGVPPGHLSAVLRGRGRLRPEVQARLAALFTL
jgi:hypothetical protein